MPLAGDDLLAAVADVVWFKDEVQLDGGYAIPSTRNLLMFLSDVRARRFKAGVFLGDDVLAAAETFRAAARTVAAGAYLPHLVEEDGGFAARWLPLDMSQGAFFVRLVDGLARFGGRTPLETGAARPDTVHDAWLRALRSDDGRVAWPDENDIRTFMRDLAVWREEEFRETATYTAPHAYASGMQAVLVNGAVAYRAGKFANDRRGRFLERS